MCSYDGGKAAPRITTYPDPYPVGLSKVGRDGYGRANIPLLKGTNVPPMGTR
jgi:hypothetical protein